jgi:hypothetical protein
MRSVLHRLLAAVLVLSLTPWAHAEFCPMQMAMPADSDRATQHAPHHATGTGHHDCCPDTAAKRAARAQCPATATLSGQTAMSCCSVESQPVNSPVSRVSQQKLAVARHLNQFWLPASTPTRIKSAEPIAPPSPVFRLKDDLRI